MNSIEKLAESMIKADLSEKFDFAENSNWDIFSLGALFSKLHVEYFTVKDIDISSRVLKHWIDMGILPIKRKKGWNRFSFVEYIWLRIVYILRTFGYPLEMVLILKNELFEPFPEKEKEQYDEGFYQKQYDECDGFIYQLSWLAFVLVIAITEKLDLNLTVLRTGKCQIVEANDLPEIKYPFLAISITLLIKDFISNELYHGIVSKIGIITPKEMEILNLIRSKQLKELKIKFRNTDKEIDLIEKTTIDKLELESRVSDVILKGGYQTITIKTEDGIIIATENIIKEKLK